MSVSLEEIKQQLSVAAEESYRQFSSKIIPGASNILGVRLPYLRRLAKQLAKDDWAGFLAIADGSSHEMLLLQGLVIGLAPADLPTMLPHINAFIDQMTNWAVCDTFAGGLKIARREPQQMRAFIISCLHSAAAYRLRFGAVMLLDYYAEQQYLAENLALLEQVSYDDYYVKMAIAWAISIFFLKTPEAVWPFLINNRLDDFTHNKAIQKICESRRITPEQRRQLHQLKRR